VAKTYSFTQTHFAIAAVGNCQIIIIINIIVIIIMMHSIDFPGSHSMRANFLHGAMLLLLLLLLICGLWMLYFEDPI
jgi:ABC-type polysaccharide/polyol phosphate export permease